MEHFRGQNITEEMLCRQAQQGDPLAEETLVLRYSRLVRVCARPFFLAGGDSEDLIQEGMLGLLSAIREFRKDEGASFRTFAELCVRRRITSAVKAASADKHTPLNDSVSLEPSLFLADHIFPFSGAGDCSQGDPEAVLIHREDLGALQKAIRSGLTALEEQVLSLYLEGLSYSEIAKEVHRSTKSVDNAVQRIRRKITRYQSQGEYSES